MTAPNFTVGNPAQVTIGWTVTNQGTGPGTVSTWVDAVIASPDDNPSDGTTLAPIHAATGLLSVNGMPVTPRARLFLLPPDFEGSYHLFVEADAGDVVLPKRPQGSVRTWPRAPNLFDVTPTPYAALVVSAVTAPATGSSGQPLQISWTVTNQGIGVTNTAEDGTILSIWQATRPERNVVADLGSFDHEGRPGGERRLHPNHRCRLCRTA